MFQKLRNKMILLNMTIISIVMIIAFAFIYFITYTNIQKENQNRFDSVHRVATLAPGNPVLHERQNNLSEDSLFVVRVPVDYSPSIMILLDNSGLVTDVITHIDLPDEVYYKIAETVWNKERNEGTVNFENRKWQYKLDEFPDRKIMRSINDHQGDYDDTSYYITFLDITDSSKTLTQLLMTFVIVGIIMLFILFGVCLYFANRSIRPIEESWEKQKQFITDASHELKTPLAIIGANTDALLTNKEEKVHTQLKWINYIKEETTRMGKLINDMLYLAKVEKTTEDQFPLDISRIVLDVIASMEAVLFEKGINLKHDIESDIIVKGDAERVKQAVLILFDNAVKYTNKCGEIDIHLGTSKNNAVFSITNSGDGIPKDKLESIFDRFYRGDPSRSQETEGYGLGLSIAKTIIERSGGRIHVDSNAENTTFTFELKLK